MYKFNLIIITFIVSCLTINAQEYGRQVTALEAEENFGNIIEVVTYNVSELKSHFAAQDSYSIRETGGSIKKETFERLVKSNVNTGVIEIRIHNKTYRENRDFMIKKGLNEKLVDEFIKLYGDRKIVSLKSGVIILELILCPPYC